MYVANIMTRQVHTIKPSDTLAAIKDIFAKVSYRHLLVAEDQHLIGVISDRDMLRHLSPFAGSEHERPIDREQLATPASDMMSTRIITVDAETLIDSASILLLENNISCLPVVKCDKKIDGILSWKDILQYHVYSEKNLAESKL